MATEKKYLSYDMLSLYDSKMKEHVAGGDAATLAEAKTYVEELGDNYDASGSAATAESNANTYTNEQIAAEKARAEAVEANLQAQINSVSNSANLEDIVNSINGFNEYMAEHGEVAEGFRTAIDANTQAIEALEETLADGVAVSWNDLEDRPFGETITTVASGSAVIPAGSTSQITVIPGGVGYLKNNKRHIHDNAIFYGIVDGVKYRLEDAKEITQQPTFCVIDGCSVVLYAKLDRTLGVYSIAAAVTGGLGRDLHIELFYSLLDVKTIDPKYLPDSADKVTLYSTTEESTKKFDVTVDDNGDISTTNTETGETKVVGSGSSTVCNLDRDDALELLLDMGLIAPAADENNSIYVDENGSLFVI